MPYENSSTYNSSEENYILEVHYKVTVHCKKMAEGAHNPGPAWPPAQLPSATGVFFFYFAFITFNPCFTAWVCHGVFTVCFLLLIYITYALS